MQEALYKAKKYNYALNWFVVFQNVSKNKISCPIQKKIILIKFLLRLQLYFAFMKINFVIDCTDDELNNYKRLNLNAPQPAGLFSRGDLSWCLQTYLILSKRKKFDLLLSNTLLENRINIIHSDQLLLLKGNNSHFIVCVRADYPKRRWAHYHLVQNKNQLSANSSFIPHWPQPGLIRRNPNRKEVLNVAYVGQIINGNLAGTVAEWKKLFKPYALNFILAEDGAWHDLSSTDILVGIRSFDKKQHNTKPPTKLFNAWHACIPFVGGYDSAFMQVGTPGDDYLLAGTPEETISAVLRLKNEPELYKKIVKNGLTKASLYNEKTIAETWENILNGPVLKRFHKWQSKKKFEKDRFQILLKAGIFEHQVKQIIKKIINK
jgi:hypothetical protein